MGLFTKTPVVQTNPVDSDADENVPGVQTPGSAELTDDAGEKTIIVAEPPLGRLLFIMSTAWFGVFLGAADTTVIATLSAPISSEFGSLSLLSWLATGYLISNAAVQPISGRLTDIFGRGPGLVVSNLVFAAGNLMCGLAKDQGTIIAGRVIAGIGGGGIMSIPTFLGSDLVPLRKRGLIGGIANLWYGVGAMFGAVIGGVLNDRFQNGWRIAFLAQVPLSVLSAIALWFIVKVPPKQSNKSYVKRIDFIGVFLITSGMALATLGLSSGGGFVPWNHPLPAATIAAAVFLFVIFIIWEQHAKQPVLPVHLLLDRTVMTACLSSVFCSAVQLASLFYVPLYLQVRGDTATMAGLKIMPASLGTAFGALFSGWWLRKRGTYVKLAIASAALQIVGAGLFVLQDGNSGWWITSIAFLIVGCGYNAIYTITQVACIAAVEHSYQAVITSSTCKSLDDEYLHFFQLQNSP